MPDIITESRPETLSINAFSEYVENTYQRRIFNPQMIDEKTGWDKLSMPSQKLIEKTLFWIRDFIIKPHPNAITPKAVCSYVESAMNNGLMYMSVAELKDPNNYQEFYTEIMRYKNILLDMKPSEGPLAELRSLVILLPQVNPEFLIPKQLKVELLNEGIMPGAFKPFNDEKAFLKYKFFPQQNPAHIFVLRYSLEQDWKIFIRWDKDLQFEPDLHPYFKRFNQS